MKKAIYPLPAILLVLLFGVVQAAWSQEFDTGYYEPASAGLLSPAELDDLLAPIALYPDPLIAQILPASTFADQIDAAARFVRQYGNTPQIDSQPWDVSVKAIAHYPDVLFMMDRKYDWTVALGQAYVEQPQDVMDAIQRLRAEASAQGNLVSNPKQQVVVTSDYISIVPVSPQYIYVPVYDPDVVYFESYDPFVPFITFGTGFLIGAWLSRDCDWRRHRVYYHGWHGGGWVGRARPHIHDRRGVYINKRASVIHVNDRVLQRDTRHYREQLHNDSIRRRQGPMLRPGQSAQPPAGRQRPPRAGQGQPGAERRRPTGTERRQAPGTTPPTAVTARPGAGPRGVPTTGPRGVPTTGPRGVPTTGTRGVPATGTRGIPATGTRGAPAAGGAAAPVVVQPAPGTGGAAAPVGVQPSPAGQGPVTRGRPEGRTGRGDVYRGRDIQRTQPASQSGYGGYGTGRDATIYRERGESSRSHMRQPRTYSPGQGSATGGVIAPAQRPTAVPSVPHAAPPSIPRSAPMPRPAPSAVTPVAPAPRAAPAIPHSAPVAPRAAPVAPRAAPMAPRSFAPAPIGPRGR